MKSVCRPSAAIGPPLAIGLWITAHIKSGHDEIWALLAELVNDDVRSAFIADPPEYIVSDDLSWLDSIIRKIRVSANETRV